VFVIGRNESEISGTDGLASAGKSHLTSTGQHVDLVLPRMGVVRTTAACSDGELPHREVGGIIIGAYEHALLYVTNYLSVVIDAGIDIITVSD